LGRFVWMSADGAVSVARAFEFTRRRWEGEYIARGMPWPSRFGHQASCENV